MRAFGPRTSAPALRKTFIDSLVFPKLRMNPSEFSYAWSKYSRSGSRKPWKIRETVEDVLGGMQLAGIGQSTEDKELGTGQPPGDMLRPAAGCQPSIP
jgi:hypothetical protein